MLGNAFPINHLCFAIHPQVRFATLTRVQPVIGSYSRNLQHFVLAQWERSQASNSLLKLFPSPLLITSLMWHLSCSAASWSQNPYNPTNAHLYHCSGLQALSLAFSIPSIFCSPVMPVILIKLLPRARLSLCEALMVVLSCNAWTLQYLFYHFTDLFWMASMVAFPC